MTRGIRGTGLKKHKREKKEDFDMKKSNDTMKSIQEEMKATNDIMRRLVKAVEINTNVALIRPTLSWIDKSSPQFEQLSKKLMETAMQIVAPCNTNDDVEFNSRA